MHYNLCDFCTVKTNNNNNNTDVGIDDMTSLLDFGFEVDFLESMDMSALDSCLDNEESAVQGFNR